MVLNLEHVVSQERLFTWRSERGLVKLNIQYWYTHWNKYIWKDGLDLEHVVGRERLFTWMSGRQGGQSLRCMLYICVSIYTYIHTCTYIYGKICTSSGEYPQRSVHILWWSSSANNSSNSGAWYVYVYIHIYASIYIHVYTWKDMYLVDGVAPEVGAHLVVKQLGE